MTDQSVIELLAQREGWKCDQSVEHSWTWYNEKSAKVALRRPDYLNDLDALQPILATLTEEEQELLDEALATEFIGGPHRRSYARFVLTIKPSQLARCIGKVIARKGE